MDNITPPPVEYKEKTQAITITHSYFKNKTPYGQFKEKAPALTKALAESSDFEIVPEYRCDGTLHWHGIVTIKDHYIWVTKTVQFLKRQGFIKLKPIDDMEKWKLYYNKQKWVAEKITKLEMPVNREVVVVTTSKKIDIPDSEDAIIEDEYLDMKEAEEQSKYTAEFYEEA